MALTFLLDEHLRGPLWNAIKRHNSSAQFPLDVVRVGDMQELSLGSLDPEILLWAETADRILLSEDKHTMSMHLADHLHTGHHSPGVFLVRLSSSIPAVVSLLEAVAYASEPDEWRDRITWIP